MKNKTLLIFLVGALLIANVALMSMAYASSPSSTTGEVGVTRGGLSINSVPTSENFGSVSVSTVDQLIPHYVFSSPVEFQDTRDTGGNYSLTVTATNFVDGAKVIGLENLSMVANSLDDASGGVTDCSAGFAALETPTAFQDTDANGESDAEVLVSTDGTQDAITHCSVTPAIDLVIPAYTSAGNYQSTIVFTIT
ncbi:MAG: hypothetical protein UT36_C0001G0200 [Candidatus Peregrinibacteria bacterium GW2011_GWF2_39_17]|nr:MAG: hypothetical protein UT36_C0001G0200 [Candidatus Peregrinibacteria bacterium GW2011_GWF2_39_17]HCW32638.1 hypothetical protein [Candidatus Peregrinibacteria bacterium]